MNKAMPKGIFIFIIFMSSLNIFAQGINFNAFSEGAERANRENQADREYWQNQKRQEQLQEAETRRYEELQRERNNKSNLLKQYKLKFNETRDFRYLFIASEMGDVEASTYLVTNGVFCSRSNGIITCSR